MQGVLTFAIALWKFGSPSKFQLPKWELTWECESSFSHSFTLLLARTLVNLCLGCKPKAKVVTLISSMQIGGFSLFDNQFLENYLGYHMYPFLIPMVVMGWITGFSPWGCEFLPSYGIKIIVGWNIGIGFVKWELKPKTSMIPKGWFITCKISHYLAINDLSFKRHWHMCPFQIETIITSFPDMGM